MTDEPTAAVTVRPMTEDEYAAYRSRAVLTYAAELERSRGMTSSAAVARSEETFPATLVEAGAQERSWLLRLLAGDEPVGWLWLGPHPFRDSGVFVYDVEIDEPRRGEGLGRQAMLAAEGIARDAGLTHIGLNVFGWNHRAESLYRSLGYQTESTQLGKTLQEPR